MLTVEDSAQAGFIHAGQLEKILKREKSYPMGEILSSIKCGDIENRLEKVPFIEGATCYKTFNGDIQINVRQRLPVLRVMGQNGDNYFIDANGKIMPQVSYPANLVIATGNISKPFATKYLTRIGRFLQGSAFWNNQIEQINVTDDHQLELIPRVGDNVIFLGDPVNTMAKLERLNIFYNKVLSVVGWGKYSEINLEYSNQIICTKKE